MKDFFAEAMDAALHACILLYFCNSTKIDLSIFAPYLAYMV